MLTCHSSQSRVSQTGEARRGQAQAGHSCQSPLELGGHQHVSHGEDLCVSGAVRDLNCPVCLQMATFPVETNCGHLFCAPCLISYWKHGSWLDAISCPLCRQKVNVLCHLFTESRSDCQQREVLGHIKDYNKRYSGAPRRVTDYLYDMPLFLHLVLRGLGNMGGLVWLFLLRVAVCCFGAAVSLASPLEGAAGHFSGALGLLDDLVVVFLLLICVININQQMTPDATARNRTATQGVLTDTLL